MLTCQEMTLGGVVGLASIWRRLRRSDVFPVGLFGGFLGFIGRRSHLVDSGGLRQLLQWNLPGTFEEMKVPLHVIASDVLSGEEVHLSSGALVDAVLASAAIPAVFPPVTLGDRVLADGALASNTPLAAALKLGAERLIVLPTGYSCALPAPPPSSLAMALHAVNLQQKPRASELANLFARPSLRNGEDLGPPSGDEDRVLGLDPPDGRIPGKRLTRFELMNRFRRGKDLAAGITGQATLVMLLPFVGESFGGVLLDASSEGTPKARMSRARQAPATIPAISSSDCPGRAASQACSTASAASRPSW